MRRLTALISAGLMSAATTASAGWLQSKSELEKPPEPLAILKTHPAFNAPPPLVRAMEVSGSGGSHLSSHRVLLPVGDGVVSVKVSAKSYTNGGYKFPEDELADYYQEHRVLGGMFLVYSQRREAESSSGESKSTWARGEAIEIRDVSGGLFPLAEGNRLRFTYLYKNSDNDISTTTAEYVVRGTQPKVKEFFYDYSQLSGKIFLVESTLLTGDENNKCEYLWSEQLQFVVSYKCGSKTLGKLIAFEMIPEGVAFAARLRQQDEAQAAAEKAKVIHKHNEDIAAKTSASRKLSAAMRARAQHMFKQAFELFQDGQFDAAVLRFKDGLGIDPANGVANFYLAETLVRQKKTTDAMPYYRWTVDFAPDSKEAAIARTKLTP